MKILNVSNTANKIPTFTSTNRTVGTSHTNHTRFFREDLNWDAFTDMLIDKYKNQNKVNIYCYACSDGSEPYSLAMLLISKLGKDGAKKFLPIMAKDADDYFFKKARKGSIEVEEKDIKRINKLIPEGYRSYLEVKPTICTDEIVLFDQAVLKPEIRNAVLFEKADIRKDIQNIESNKTVLMFRNAWPYLNQFDQKKLAKDISEKLGENSILVVGSFDAKSHYFMAENYLQKNGFHIVDVPLCYEKAPSFCGAHPLNNPHYLFNTYAGKK